MQKSRAQAFSRALLNWFSLHGRKDLPWQQNKTPYRVWVSEIMLQQTRVAAVIPYYLRFMQAFPRIADLAAADADEVLHHWSGLGYYARARNLHLAARVIMKEHGGRFPEEYEQVLALPGIGESTAGAILSLALGQHHAILDGNVKRVLARVFLVEGWPGKAAVQKELWALSRALTPVEHVQAYNQAIMDLGATLCVRGKVNCKSCPLCKLCAACQGDCVADYPSPKPSRVLPRRSVQMLLVMDQQRRILLEKRPPAGIWGGLWSFPELAMEENAAGWLSARSAASSVRIRRLPVRKHSFSHFHLHIHPRLILLQKPGWPALDGDRQVWYNLSQTQGRGLAAPVQQLLRELEEESK
ncbi:A/G-specific adenine glycosylase [Thiolapillus sp.]